MTATALPLAARGLVLHGVGVALGGRTVLEGIDLAVPASERLCLLGPNGVGKSTLLRTITGLFPEHTGDVLLDGTPVERWSRDALARRIAVVAQPAVLPFHVRVEDLVALGRIPHAHPWRGPREADRRAVDRALDRVGAEGLRERDVRELSLGERQLVLIATALAQEAPLLLLDEPTVHLDLRHQVEVMELLRDLNERDGVGVIAVLHDLTLAAHFFPRLALLSGGRLVADGPPAEVLSPERVRGVFGVDPGLVRLPEARARA